MKKLIYLDCAAATPLDRRVRAAMQPYFAEQFYNPSANYLPAQAVKNGLEQARASVAYWLGAKPAEIIFTAGATEANNLAIRGVMEQFPEGNVVVSAVEHESVLAPARRWRCREVPVSPDGTLDTSVLQGAIDDNTVLVSVMYANNEIGTVQPLRKIAETIKQKRTARSSKLPLYFHTDAAQAANYLDLHATRLGVDLMSVNGGKIYGPKQSGALYARAGVELWPLILGGGQESGLRSGTENVTGCVGLAAALDIAQGSRHGETARLKSLQDYFFKELRRQMPTSEINGSLKRRLPNNVHVTFPGTDNERLIMQLDEAGIMAAAGSACSASREEPSHVLAAIGLGEAEAESSVRFTMGRAITKNHIDQTIAALKSFMAKKKKNNFA